MHLRTLCKRFTVSIQPLLGTEDKIIQLLKGALGGHYNNANTINNDEQYNAALRTQIAYKELG